MYDMMYRKNYRLILSGKRSGDRAKSSMIWDHIYWL